jgi:3-methyladenine DNA glycosylase AlkD
MSISLSWSREMNTVSDVMAELEKKGSEKTRVTYARHGIAGNVYGVLVADLKVIAKKFKGDQALACALYETRNYDAMYLAGIVVDGSRMSKKQLDAWAKGATFGQIAQYTVPAVACESPHARALADTWIDSKQETIAASGWCTWSGIVATRPDDELDLEEINGLLNRIVKQIDAAPHRVRYAMNGFVISVGTYVKPLLKAAKSAAKKLGKVAVDMGDTACKVPNSLEYIEKVESMGRVGKKRKTMKC